MPNGLIAEDSLRVHPEGLALSLTLPWYRSLWLSSVGTLKVTIDGVEVPADDIAFELKGVRYTLDQLPEQSDVLWYLQEHPLLIVRREAPIAARRDARGRASSASCACPTCRSRPGEDGGPGMYVPNFVRQSLDADGDGSGCRTPGARVGRAAAASGDRRRPLQARTHALLGQRRVPRRLVRLRRAARPRRRARHRPGHRDRRLAGAADVPDRLGRVRDATGGPRSTSTASTRARSAPTSTWAGAATAT